MKISIAQVAQLLGGSIEGNDSDEVWSVGKIEEATEGQISFLSNPTTVTSKIQSLDRLPRMDEVRSEIRSQITLQPLPAHLWQE